MEFDEWYTILKKWCIQKDREIFYSLGEKLGNGAFG
jgi:hypothetical protein